MNVDAAMFLVRVEIGKKRGRVYRVDPWEASTNYTGFKPPEAVASRVRRRERAWEIRPTYPPGGKVIGFAAVAVSVDEAYRRIEELREHVSAAKEFT
jgi:hypothetical protein